MRISLLGGLGLLALALTACAQPSQPPAETAANAPPAAPPPPPAFDIHTLRDLVGVCRTAQSDPYYGSAEGLCWGYASGVLDFYMVDTGSGHRPRRVCLPTAVPTRTEAVGGLMTWADANQQFMDESAPVGLMRFYMTQYPCAQPTRGRKPPRR